MQTEILVCGFFGVPETIRRKQRAEPVAGPPFSKELDELPSRHMIES
jgi:hypothetical protein